MGRFLTLTLALALAATLSTGCAQSAKIAQVSFDRGMEVQRDVREALFTKGWGMTRIAGHEANSKAVAEAKVDLLRAQLDGTFTPEKSEEILDGLAQRIANNEPPVSKSFAWLSFLMVQGERADAMLGNVDYYLESQRPIWSQVSEQVPGTLEDAKQAYENWKDVIGPVWDAVKGLFPSDQPAGPAPEPEPAELFKR